MQTQQTKDYGQFKLIAANRPVDQAHVNRLVSKIEKKNLLHLNPILCNEAYEVLDGQHRLAAARQMGVCVFYNIDGSVSEEDIAGINSNSKSWSLYDYINFWSVKNKPGFDVFTGFMLDNPLIVPSVILNLIGVNNTSPKLRDGIVDVSKYDQAVRIAGILKEYLNLIPWAYEKYFIMAVINAVTTPGYDHEKMQRKLSFQSRSLVKCINTRQYTEMLEEIYHYSDSKSVPKLKFDLR